MPTNKVAKPSYTVMDREGRIHVFHHFPSHANVMSVENSGDPNINAAFAPARALASTRVAASPPPQRISGFAFLGVAAVSIISLVLLAARLKDRYTWLRTAGKS